MLLKQEKDIENAEQKKILEKKIIQTRRRKDGKKMQKNGRKMQKRWKKDVEKMEKRYRKDGNTQNIEKCRKIQKNVKEIKCGKRCEK